MDYGMQRYLKILNESHHDIPEDKTEIMEAIDKLEIFEDNGLSRSGMAKKLTINEDDVDFIFQVLSETGNAESKLSKIDKELSFNGIETISPENSDEMVHYLRNGDLYKETIIYYNGKYYVGSIGALLESDFDLSRIQRIK